MPCDVNKSYSLKPFYQVLYIFWVYRNDAIIFSKLIYEKKWHHEITESLIIAKTLAFSKVSIQYTMTTNSLYLSSLWGLFPRSLLFFFTNRGRVANKKQETYRVWKIRQMWTLQDRYIRYPRAFRKESQWIMLTVVCTEIFSWF